MYGRFFGQIADAKFDRAQRTILKTDIAQWPYTQHLNAYLGQVLVIHALEEYDLEPYGQSSCSYTVQNLPL